MAVQLRFFGNAFVEVLLESGKRIVCDPWIEEGAYYGTWWHFPPMDVPPEVWRDVDYLFISHLHPDHFDPGSLRRFDPSTPVVISERKNPAFRALLSEAGFTNVIVVAPNEEHTMDGFSLRVWNDFGGEDVARRDTIPFELDSAIAIREGDVLLFNANDNILEPGRAREVRDALGPIDVAMLPYAGAGPYPQIFANLSVDEKMRGRQRVQDRFLSNFLSVSRILSARTTVPVAGEYVLAGRNHALTQFIHTPTPAEISRAWQQANPEQRLVQLFCGDKLAVRSGEVHRAGPPRDYTHQDRVDYAAANRAATYVIDEFKVPTSLRLSPEKLLTLLNTARARMDVMQKRMNLSLPLEFRLVVPGTGQFETRFDGEPTFRVVDGQPAPPYLQSTIAYEHLIALLTRHVSWNNLEGGCLLIHHREPENYVPDAHLLLSFFHI